MFLNNLSLCYFNSLAFMSMCLPVFSINDVNMFISTFVGPRTRFTQSPMDYFCFVSPEHLKSCPAFLGTQQQASDSWLLCDAVKVAEIPIGKADQSAVMAIWRKCSSI